MMLQDNRTVVEYGEAIINSSGRWSDLKGCTQIKMDPHHMRHGLCCCRPTAHGPPCRAWATAFDQLPTAAATDALVNIATSSTSISQPHYRPLHHPPTTRH